MAVSVGVASSGAGSRHTPAARGSTRDLAPSTKPQAPRRGAPFPKRPFYCQLLTKPCGLALHCAGGQTTDDVLLQCQEDDQHRQ